MSRLTWSRWPGFLSRTWKNRVSAVRSILRRFLELRGVTKAEYANQFYIAQGTWASCVSGSTGSQPSVHRSKTLSWKLPSDPPVFNRAAYLRRLKRSLLIYLQCVRNARIAVHTRLALPHYFVTASSLSSSLIRSISLVSMVRKTISRAHLSPLLYIICM